MQAPRGGGFLRKRKEREHGYYPSSWTTPSQQAVRMPPPPPPPPPPFFVKPDRRATKPNRPTVARLGASAKPPALPPPADAAKCAAGTKLLAGYLAHEFLTYGTLLGEPRLPPPLIQKEKEPAAPSGATAVPEPSERYAEVSRLLMEGGARIPGVVNPSQLGGWLGIKK